MKIQADDEKNVNLENTEKVDSTCEQMSSNEFADVSGGGAISDFGEKVIRKLPDVFSGVSDFIHDATPYHKRGLSWHITEKNKKK